MTVPHIEVDDLEISYGGVKVVGPVSFQVMPGQQLTLLGPSGCGKTTTLRALAGLEQPSAGSIRVGGTTMFSGRDGIEVPAEKRGLSMVFQSYAIWPHMSVFENVAYGLRVRKRPAAEVKDRVHAALELVQMAGFAARPASALSGGQQQRVALARACAFSPTVLLFDEPLSNLDAKLRGDMRIELRELQHRLGVTSVYVTHDLEEALAMSDQIVVMRAGAIEQTATPDEIYNRPRTRFVADFVGSANILTGRHRPGLSADGLVAVDLGADVIVHASSYGRPVADEVALSVRTVHFQASLDRPDGDLNLWPVTIRRAIFLGDMTQLHVDWAGQEVVVRCTALNGLPAGTTAWLSVDPRHCVVLEV